MPKTLAERHGYKGVEYSVQPDGPNKIGLTGAVLPDDGIYPFLKPQGGIGEIPEIDEG